MLSHTFTLLSFLSLSQLNHKIILHWTSIGWQATNVSLFWQATNVSLFFLEPKTTHFIKINNKNIRLLQVNCSLIISSSRLGWFIFNILTILCGTIFAKFYSLETNLLSLFLTPPMYPGRCSLLSTSPMKDSILGSVHPRPAPGLLLLGPGNDISRKGNDIETSNHSFFFN